MSTSTSISTSTSTSTSVRKMEEEAKARERQGIGSILGSEPERPKTAASLRRTLSADMSSKKWLGRHGLTTPLKKIPSSESFPIPSSSVDSDSSSSSSSEGEGDDWSPIVESEDEEQQKKKEDLERPRLSDIWGSILSQKAEDLSNSSSAPYIHPLVKRSKSSLSQKSLEICTESLGSETGSEGFSSNPPSETGDFEDKLVEKKQSIKETEELSSPAATPVKEKEEFGAVKNSPPRSFPPPLPSLSRRDGPGFLMQSHRRDGRLVLEAVPVSTYNYFHAERQGGRLLLSFINKPSAVLMDSDYYEEEVEEEDELELEEEEEEEEGEDIFDGFEGLGEEEQTEKGRGILTEVVKDSQPTLMVTCEVINLPGSAALLTNKLLGLTNKNPNWCHSQKKNVILEEEEEEMEEELTQLPQSLPCPPRMACLMPSTAAAATATAASFNAYDYFWRTKPTTAAAAMNSLTQQQPPPPQPPPPIIDNNNYCSYYYSNKHNNNIYNNKIVISNSKGGFNPREQQKQMLVLGGNEADCLVPQIRGGCKESRNRSSLFIWQPARCIATS
ncbi:protein FAF-like, chloroplastic [Macadamia integrifolia]|uniref:protein FAF-like, chloroplastic n=1 Tax=Macadamia integrifolia TaxID=60698 RepID=UPI001C4EB090|nr:protein FAF-like, chloroplastic [Macadamia integrifolia]